MNEIRTMDKEKLRQSIGNAILSSNTPETFSDQIESCTDTIIDILEILHRDEITVSYAKYVLQDTYKIMCLGAKF